MEKLYEKRSETDSPRFESSSNLGTKAIFVPRSLCWVGEKGASRDVDALARIATRYARSQYQLLPAPDTHTHTKARNVTSAGPLD